MKQNRLLTLTVLLLAPLAALHAADAPEPATAPEAKVIAGRHNRPDYNKNTEIAPKEQVITDGGIRMEIGKTIRLTPAPISADHPWMNAARLQNGDLIFNCPLAGGTHRDFALSPKEDGGLCSLRSKDNGQTWQKSFSQTTRDGGKTWTSEPTAVGRHLSLKNGSILVPNYDKGRMFLSPAGDTQTVMTVTNTGVGTGYAATMVELSDGSILCAGQAAFVGKKQRAAGADKSKNAKNPDTGETLNGGFYIKFKKTMIQGDGGWEQVGSLSSTNFNPDMSHGFETYAEPFFLKATNGDLLMFLRTQMCDSTGTPKGKKYPPVKVTRSTDEGKTWSKPIEVHPTGVMPVATLLNNGIIVAFTGRHGNRVAASRDNGLTWHCQHNVMSTAQAPNFSGHNAIVPVGDATALLIYTHNHRHPDAKAGFAPNNLYAAELIGTFVTFKPTDGVNSGER